MIFVSLSPKARKKKVADFVDSWTMGGMGSFSGSHLFARQKTQAHLDIVAQTFNPQSLQIVSGGQLQALSILKMNVIALILCFLALGLTWVCSNVIEISGHWNKMDLH